MSHSQSAVVTIHGAKILSTGWCDMRRKFQRGPHKGKHESLRRRGLGRHDGCSTRTWTAIGSCLPAAGSFFVPCKREEITIVSEVFGPCSAAISASAGHVVWLSSG